MSSVASTASSSTPPPTTHWDRIKSRTYNDVVKPIYVGMACGVGSFVIQDLTLNSINFFASLIVGDKKWNELTDEVRPHEKTSFVESDIIDPLFEEAFCRVIIHGSIAWVAHQILPEQEYSPGIGSYRCSIKLSQLVSSIASGIIFGMLHYRQYSKPLTAITQVILCSMDGIVWGILKEKQGLAAPIAAHISFNIAVSGFKMVKA
jgi:hypothetical protein